MVASFGLGYRSGLRSYPELFARLLLAPLWALLGASIVGSMVSAFTRGRTPAFLALLASGVVLTALITAHLHRPWVRALRVPGRTRRRVVAGLSVALLVTSFGLSSKLRCRLGNAVSCRDAAGNENDPEATAWFERGCEGGDALLCEHLADRYREGRGVPKDLKKAEEHLVDACAMGLDSACAGVEEMALVGGCDRYDLTSCRRLAAARPHDAAVTRKACLLGDEGACRRGGGR